MKGARDLTRRELAILRELVPWRDEIAGQLDRATFRVIGNEQLLGDFSSKTGDAQKSLARSRVCRAVSWNHVAPRCSTL